MKLNRRRFLAATAATLPDGFQEEIVLGNLNSPTMLSPRMVKRHTPFGILHVICAPDASTRQPRTPISSSCPFTTLRPSNDRLSFAFRRVIR